MNLKPKMEELKNYKKTKGIRAEENWWYRLIWGNDAYIITFFSNDIKGDIQTYSCHTEKERDRDYLRFMNYEYEALKDQMMGLSNIAFGAFQDHAFEQGEVITKRMGEVELENN